MRGPLLVVAALFLVAPAAAQHSNAPLSLEQQTALRASVFAATQAADFKPNRQLLEVYRTLRAAGVTLTSAEAFEMGEYARYRGLAIEAADAFALLRGDDPEYRRNEGLIASVKRSAAQDLAGGVEKSAGLARERNDRDYLALVAEAFAGQGDFGRAIALYERALDLNVNDPTTPQFDDPRKWTDADIAQMASESARLNGRDASFYVLEFRQRREGVFGFPQEYSAQADKVRIQLNYGISLMALKRVDEARATWSAITGSPSIEILVKAWIDIADRSTN